MEIRQNGSLIDLQILFVDPPGDGVTTATGVLYVFRQSDKQYYTGSAWQVARSSSTGFAKMGDTNHPGWWEYTLDTDGWANDEYIFEVRDTSGNAVNVIETATVLVGGYVDFIDGSILSRSSHSAADVWAVGTRTLTSFGTLVADIASAVWSAGTRTLTGFGTLVADIWSSVTRSLTDKAGFTIAGTKQTLDSLNDITAANVDTVLTGSHNGGSWNPADVSGVATQASLDLVKSQTDKMNFTGDDIKATLDGEKVEIVDDGINAVTVEDFDAFKADVSLLATEGQAAINTSNIISQVDDNEALLDAIGIVVLAIRAKTDNLPVDPASVTNQTLINDIVTLIRKLMTGSEGYALDNETIQTLDDDDSTVLKEHKALNKNGAVINKTQYNETTPAGRTQLVDP